MKKITLALAISSVALFAGKDVTPVTTPAVDVPTPAPAKISNNGVALKIGTLGVGLDYEHFFNKKFALRTNINYFKYTKNHKNIGDVNYDAKLTLFSAGLLADYHPWASSFRLSTGIYYNGNKLKGTARPTSGTVTYGGQTYNSNDISWVKAKVDFRKVAPYLGIGWSSVESNGWHFSADIGVLFVGKPKIYTKAYSSNPIIQAQLNNDVNTEKQKIYKDVKKYKYWPVISIGIEKKF